MYPFERFAERAKKALTLAQQEAESAGHSYIGTEHLLLGVLREEGGLARAVLESFGVELDRTRQSIQAILSRATGEPVAEIVPTSRVRKVIELAFEEARRMGHSYVGTEHLLLGLLVEGKGVAAHVLADFGVTLEKTRAEIDRLLLEGVRESTPSPEAVRRRIAASMSMQPGLQQLLQRARQRAAGRGLPTFGIDDLLQAIASSSAGIEALARLLDLRRIAAMKEQALAAQDFETASTHRADEQRALSALGQAVAAWRRELEPPRTQETSSS